MACAIDILIKAGSLGFFCRLEFISESLEELVMLKHVQHSDAIGAIILSTRGFEPPTFTLGG